MIKSRIKVGFQGEIGAYSEEAALEFFGKNIKVIPYETFNDVFKMVEKGKINYGIIPIENSIEGSIGQNYDLLLKSNLKIFGEKVLRIHHCLIVNKGVKLNLIKKVYSHPQALGQCREFLRKLKLEEIPFYDTAGSCQMIKEKKLRDSAAIASERAAKVYNLRILRRGIETNHKNFTRFFIIGEKDRQPTGNDKTSIIFSTKHSPGALYKALGIFALSGINLTKLESRPIIGKPWKYNFYLDFEGHKKEEKIRKALESMKNLSISLKILGSYPKMKR
jgi:chorismate mutase / prephenate dehydratase